MASRRMISSEILFSEEFLQLPTMAAVLYVHLLMRADDDGFMNSPRTMARVLGATEEDLSLLIEKGYIIPFENSVVAITHWHIHNHIRKECYTPTMYPQFLNRLKLSKDGVYSLLPASGKCGS